MTLRTFLDQRGITPKRFGVAVGVSEHTVIKWLAGTRIPRKEQMVRIVDLTEGLVRADDFYGLPRGDAA